MLLKLKKLRTSLGITQAEAGKEIGISEIHYMRKENQDLNKFGKPYYFNVNEHDLLYKLFMKTAKNKGRKLNINMFELLK